MPKYKVKAKGFHGGKLYDPNGKRSFLYTDKPLKPVPKWLEPLKAETAKQKEKRLAAEKQQSDADQKKAKEDQKDVSDLTFMGDGENSSAVETL